MKTIVYFHGFASSSQSNTIAYFTKEMQECRIIAPDIPVDPEEALPFLKNFCAANKPDLIIGTSMGGMYAMQQTDYPRIAPSSISTRQRTAGHTSPSLRRLYSISRRWNGTCIMALRKRARPNAGASSLTEILLSTTRKSSPNTSIMSLTSTASTV